MRKDLGRYYLKIGPWGDDKTVDPTRLHFKITAHDVKTDVSAS